MKYKFILSLQDKLGYFFKNITLLSLALTHCSVSKLHNERLEFLGDSVLNNIITLILYKKFPYYNEGILSRIRSSLVKSNTLAKIAQKLNISKYLKLGAGELKTKGYNKISILANAMEAIIGAIFLDTYYECNTSILEILIFNLFKKYLNINCKINIKDPKTRLQEFLQSNKLNLPIYKLIIVKGKAHNQKFSIQCILPNCYLKIIATGNSIKKAQQKAALQALIIIKKNNFYIK